MAVYRRGKVKGFGNQRGPSVAPQKAYKPARRAQKPSGYAEIEAATQFDWLNHSRGDLNKAFENSIFPDPASYEDS